MRITGKMMYDGLSSAEKIEFEKWLLDHDDRSLNDLITYYDSELRIAISLYMDEIYNITFEGDFETT